MGAITRRGLVTTAIAAATPALAQSMNSEADIEAAIAARRLVGLTTAVVRRGETVQATGYGLASIPFAARVDATTLFQVGSLGKQFTACGVLRLAEAGRFSLEQPIGALISGLPASWRGATVRRLLTHTGGLPAYEAGDFPWDRPATRESVIGAAGDAVYFPPGDAWLYSNTGYVVLGWLIENITGQSYGDYVRTEIFEPLGMQDARPDDAEAVIARRAEPYEVIGGEIRNAVRMSSSVSSMPDGGLLLSARDYARWLRELRSPTLLSPASARQTRTAATLSSGARVPYGMGWFLDRVRGEDLLWHSGSVPGVTSYAMWTQNSDVAAFVSSNLESPAANAEARKAVTQLAGAYAPRISPYTLAPIRDRAPERTSAALAVLSRGDDVPDAALFAPNIQRALSAATHQEFAPTIRNINHLDVVEQFGFLDAQARRYRLNFGGDRPPRHILCLYDREGRISWML